MLMRQQDNGNRVAAPGRNGRSASAISPSVRRGIELLAEAMDYAREVGQEHSQFAVELSHILAEGLSVSDCRYLVAQGVAAHLQEVTDSQCDRRQFRKGVSLAFNSKSCFVLTEEGADLLDRNDFVASEPRRSVFAPEPVLEFEAAEKPQFITERRELVFSGRVVKRFKQPSANQERILIAFQEEDWPTHIDDPLPPRNDMCNKHRLGDAIKALNRHQKAKLLIFSRDGTGEGICWEPA